MKGRTLMRMEKAQDERDLKLNALLEEEVKLRERGFDQQQEEIQFQV